MYIRPWLKWPYPWDVQILRCRHLKQKEYVRYVLIYKLNAVLYVTICFFEHIFTCEDVLLCWPDPRHLWAELAQFFLACI